MRATAANSSAALRAALAVVLVAGAARAQSAADLRARMAIDGRTTEWTAVEAVFRDPQVCPGLEPPAVCPTDEEPDADSRSSPLQDLRQLRVTWDAHNLYIAAEARVDGAVLVVWLDYRPGGLRSASTLDAFRRSLAFGPEMRPDAFLAVVDRQPVPELYLVQGEEQATRVASDAFVGAASFDAEAADRALEAALPWTLLFPDAVLAVDSETGAPLEPMFALPPGASGHGLRVAAAVVDAGPGLGALDVAPDPVAGVPEDRREVTVVDRAAFIDWDASKSGPPDFVDFGAAVQTQAAPRFRPAPPGAAQPFQLTNLRTFAGGAPSRLLVPDAGLDLAFAFDIEPLTTGVVYLTASVYSLRGDRVAELCRDAPRSAGSPGPPFGSFGDAARDRWDGRDAAGRPVPGGVYVLHVAAGTAPGAPTASERRGITVVR